MFVTGGIHARNLTGVTMLREACLHNYGVKGTFPGKLPKLAFPQMSTHLFTVPDAVS